MNEMINRSNWKSFCQEAAITIDEYENWMKAAAAMTEDAQVFNFVYGYSEKEREEVEAAELHSSIDWSDMVAQQDAERRLMRAEIRAYHLFNI